MTQPDFRTLAQELFLALETEAYAHWAFNPEEDPLFKLARTELATPPPEPPTDEELVNFRNRATADCCSSRSNNGANLLSDDDLAACQAAGLRAVLERWG